MSMGRFTVAIAWIACAIVAGASLTACLTVADVAGDGSPRDASADTAPVCNACGAAAGFSPLLFALDRATECPAGMLAADVLADPGAAPSGACSCKCVVSNPPSCFPATLVTGYDQTGTASCGSAGATLQVADAGCGATNGLVGTGHLSINPFVPDAGGTCSDVTSNDPSLVPTVTARTCAPGSCASPHCSAVAGFRPCFRAPGDVDCPAGLTKHVVGAQVDLACTCGACSASASGACEGTVTFYTDTACTSSIGKAFSADATCQSTTLSTLTAVKSFRYTPDFVGGCVPGAPSVASVGLTDRATICCPP